MWVPASAAELEEAALAASIEEGPHLDGKLAISKTAELAKDVAAMTSDGGVIIIGLGEDDHRRLTILAPFETAGVPERIDQVVQTSIDPAPHVEIKTLGKADGTGYVVVVVPPSALAPHQVTVGGDLRYYGRSATGNRRLTEGEVARLYARREAWSVDAAGLLQDEVEGDLLPPDDALAYLFAFVRPVAAQADLLERGSEGSELSFLQQRLDSLRSTARSQSNPSFHYIAQWLRRGASGWHCSSSAADEAAGNPEHVLHMEVDLDGTGHLFHGRVGARRGADGPILVFRDTTADLFGDLLMFSGDVLDRLGYRGDVDIGVAVTNLKGSIAVELADAHRPTPYAEDDFRGVERVRVKCLLDEPHLTARRIMRRFLIAFGGRAD